MWLAAILGFGILTLVGSGSLGAERFSSSAVRSGGSQNHAAEIARSPIPGMDDCRGGCVGRFAGGRRVVRRSRHYSRCRPELGDQPGGLHARRGSVSEPGAAGALSTLGVDLHQHLGSSFDLHLPHVAGRQSILDFRFGFGLSNARAFRLPQPIRRFRRSLLPLAIVGIIATGGAGCCTRSSSLHSLARWSREARAPARCCVSPRFWPYRRLHSGAGRSTAACSRELCWGAWRRWWLLTGVVGWQPLWKRLQEPNPYSLRKDLVLSSIAMVSDRPLTGFGLGTWPEAYPGYARFDDGTYVNQAHNDWVQWAAEGGLLFLALMLAIAGWSVGPAVRSLWGVGILSVWLHALMDYPMQQRPALAAFFFALLGTLAATAAATPETSARDDAQTTPRLRPDR